MFRAVVILAVLLPCFAIPSGRISGGTTADIKNFPYQVSLQVNQRHNCGGSIISKEWVVTAAHCLDNRPLDTQQIRVGSSLSASGGSVHKLTQQIVHEDYSTFTVANDIALLKVSPAFTFSDTVKPIELQSEPVPAGSTAIVSGWGLTEDSNQPSPVLREVSANVFDLDTCKSRYGSLITNEHLCAGYFGVEKGPCSSDSGGPLTFNGKLIGVVSMGQPCGSIAAPAIYASIPAYRSWILSHADLS